MRVKSKRCLCTHTWKKKKQPRRHSRLRINKVEERRNVRENQAVEEQTFSRSRNGGIIFLFAVGRRRCCLE